MSLILLNKTPEGGENGLLSTRVALQLLSMTGLLFVMGALEINPVIREVYRNTLMYLGSAMILANKRETRDYVRQLFNRAAAQNSCWCAISLPSSIRQQCSSSRVSPLSAPPTTTVLTFKSLIFKPLPKPSFGWTLIKYGFVMCLDVKAEESKHSSTELKLKLTVKFWQ